MSRYLLENCIRWNNTNLSEQRNDVTKNTSTLTCTTPIPKLLFLIKLSKKSKKYGSHTTPSYSYSHISVFYFSAISRDIDLKFIQDTYRVPKKSDLRMSKVTVTGTVHFFQIFFMGTSWVAISIKNIKTRASREMTSRKISNFSILMGWT